MSAVQLLGEGEARIVDPRGRHDDARPTGEEPFDNGCGDRLRSGTGHEGDIARELVIGLFEGGLRDVLEGESLLAFGVLRVPLRQIGKIGASGAESVKTQSTHVEFTGGGPGEIFAGKSPTVIEKDCALRSESGAHRVEPADTEFGIHGGRESGEVFARTGSFSLFVSECRDWVARSPSEPRILSVRAVSAAESTSSPEAPPPVPGAAIAMPSASASAPTAASTRASTSEAEAGAGGSEARAPPRTESPSRVSRRIRALTRCAHPWPSCQWPVTRLDTCAALSPAPPSSTRSLEEIASLRTGPKAA